MLPKFEIFGLLAYTYPLLMGAAWGVAINYAKYLDSKNQTQFRYLNFFFAGLFLASWLGAKVFYLLTADFDGKELALESSSFWLGGGFVFYGGLIFGALFCLLFSILSKQGLKKFNIFLAPLALGHGIGRLGCLLAGCCYGSATNSSLSIELWGEHRHPTQIYEALFLFGLAWLFRSRRLLSSSNALWLYFLSYATLRFLIEFIRGDALRGVYALGLSTSQLIALGMIAVSIFVLRGVVKRSAKNAIQRLV